MTPCIGLYDVDDTCSHEKLKERERQRTTVELVGAVRAMILTITSQYSIYARAVGTAELRAGTLHRRCDNNDQSQHLET